MSLERAADAVVTMLGVMAAGACYVPMDTDLPLERVRLIERDAELGLMVVSEHTPADGGAPRVTPAELEAAGPGPHAVPLPDDVAYVIYTSGSTGTPKGVAVTHANVTALLDGCARIFDFGAADAWSCFHSFAFDFSVWEIWCALMTGGTTVVATRAETRSPARFAELLARESVTILSQTPSAFRALRDEVLARPRSDFRLRHVVFGGEALDPTTLREWFDAFGDETPRMTNMYGITETTVHVTHHRLTRADSRGAASPIGRPLPHLGVLLLNAGGGLAPAGAPAELLVTGAGVAQGYLGRAELTASRFPVLSEPSGARAYRSGDLARLEADGTLTFLSRADAQVKVRGHRIEPGEIEDVLRRHERVADARVVARRSEAGAVDLAAYVIASGSMPAAAELREHVLRSLPPYMVPRWFVAVAAFPLTRNGKLDVAALPRPEAERDAGIEFVAPAGTLEQSIARVWCDVLGVEAVGTRDNFFDLGGDSLMLVRVAGRLSEALGRRIEVVKLFEFTTVSSLAAHLAAAAPPDAERYEEVAARAARQRGNFLAARRG